MAIYSITGPAREEDQQFADAKEVPVSEITRGYTAGDFERILIRDNKVFAITHSGAAVQSYKEARDSVSLLGWNNPENKTVVEIENREAENLFIAILPDLLFFLLIISGIIWLFRGIARSQSSALSFGKSRARVADAKQVNTRFKDVAGAEEAKEDLVEVVDFLKNPKKYINLGAKIPKGVLLVGAPGTGKTLLARAVAGEAAVPFFSIAGSEFVEMFVGVGASRVRDLFEQAKRHSPCIVFVDEIDAVGRQRGAGLGGSHDEREQTLNQILVEMDGFDTDTNVIIVAATNRPDILDPALLRPGRFDRRVVLDRPDILGREAIFGVHVRGKPLAPDVQLDVLAKSTPGFVGADIENTVNEAAILAARRNQQVISMRDMEDAIERVVLGPERKTRIFTERERKVTAYHEAGHAIVARAQPDGDSVRKVTIIPRGIAGGLTWYLADDEDQRLATLSKLKARLASMLGGRAAEELVFSKGEVTTGASNDLEQVTSVARRMVTRWGMSEKLGPMAFGKKEELIFLGREIGEQRDFSEAVAEEIDAEVRGLVSAAHQLAGKILKKRRAKLDEVANHLLNNETLEMEQFEALWNGEPVPPPKPPPPPAPPPAKADAGEGAQEEDADATSKDPVPVPSGA